jgi:hypothetical protein
MNESRTHSKAMTWLNRFQQRSPRLLTAGALTTAVVLTVAHYTFGEWAFHPDIELWDRRAFWSDFPRYAVLPLLLWCGWSVVSLSKLETSKFFLGVAAVVCAGDLIFYLIPSVLGSLERLGCYQFKLPVEKWHWKKYWYWWTLWMPAIVAIGNLVLLQRWWRLFFPKIRFCRTNDMREKTSGSRNLISMAFPLTVGVLAIAAIYLILPQMPAGGNVLSLAETLLVPARLTEDFEYVTKSQDCREMQVSAVLDQVKLADLERRQFYKNIDDSSYRDYILSPRVDLLPLDELDWRRTLWKNFFPPVQQESDPVKAAKIVIRKLREQVGIDPSYDYPVGVETIWREQMTDEVGFERIYVACLRSVGIAARLDENCQAELFVDGQWRPTPRPPVFSFESDASSLPKTSWADFRNWADDSWPQ